MLVSTATSSFTERDSLLTSGGRDFVIPLLDVSRLHSVTLTGRVAVSRGRAGRGAVSVHQEWCGWKPSAERRTLR